MPDFTCLDENLFAKVAQTLLQHISSTHCNFKSALGPSILLLCVRLADVQMNGFINYCEKFDDQFDSNDTLNKCVLLTLTLSNGHNLEV